MKKTYPPLTSEQEILILTHMDHAKICARVAWSRHREVPLSEFISEAYVGLVKSAHNFREGRKANFKTYSQYRIDGSISDYLRSWEHRNAQRQRKNKAPDLIFDSKRIFCFSVREWDKAIL